MEQALRAAVTLLVNHREATGYFEPWLEEITYVDHMAGESDGLEIRLDNSEGRWLNEWYPIKGTSIEASIGHEDGDLLPTGVCQVDEIELEGPPSLVVIKALGAGNTKAIRTPKSKAYEGKSLRSIAQEVAETHDLTLVGEVPDLTWRRATQHRETDLGFLSRLGDEHGIVFSVKGDKLVFHDLQALEAKPAILVLVPENLSRYHFREKMVPGHASASYFDGSTKELRVVELQVESEHAHPDKKKVRRRTENAGHTQRLAKAAMHSAKGWERDGTLSLPGDTRLVAGGNIELSEFGVLDGLWMVRSARHKVVRGQGYTTEIEVRHVAK